MYPSICIFCWSPVILFEEASTSLCVVLDFSLIVAFDDSSALVFSVEYTTGLTLFENNFFEWIPLWYKIEKRIEEIDFMYSGRERILLPSLSVHELVCFFM